MMTKSIVGTQEKPMERDTMVDWELVLNALVSICLPIVLYFLITRWAQLRGLVGGRGAGHSAAAVAEAKSKNDALRRLLASATPEEKPVCANQCVARCGHACAGRQGELLKDCVVCVDAACSGYADGACCPVCLESYALEHPEDTREPLTRLPCGCVIHLHCFLLQLHNGFPTRFITFSFLKCPSCTKYVFDPSQAFLETVWFPFGDVNEVKESPLHLDSAHSSSHTSSSSSSPSSYLHDDLRFPVSVYRSLFHQVLGEIQRLVCEDFSLKGEASAFYKQHVASALDPSISQSASTKLLLEFAQDHLRFYLCEKCSSVYYGGTKDCRAELEAQNQREQAESGSSTAEEKKNAKLLCQVCVSQGPGQRRICFGDPATHQQAYVWKCRFCCQVATFFCLGQYHVCGKCHVNLNARINHTAADQDERAYCPRNDVEEGKLGGAGQCPLGIDKPHYSGPESRGEMLLRCGLCDGLSSSAIGQPSPSSSSSFISPLLQGGSFSGESANLLVNPVGRLGYEGWVREGPGQSGWAIKWVNPEKTPSQTDSAFVTSDELIMKHQEVDLSLVYHHSFLDTAPEISVGEWYASAWQSPSFYCMQVQLLDAKRHVLHEFDSGKLQGMPEMWQHCEHNFKDYGSGARFVVFSHGGKSARRNENGMGPRMTNASVRLVE